MKKIMIITLLFKAMNIFSCAWDYDTIKMEKQTFPGLQELITGQFLRHSTEFYEWRINDRKKKIGSGIYTQHDIDDLAIAYDKVGKSQLALNLQNKQLIDYNNRYETLANLGTIYIHSGQLKEGLKYLKESIKINPDAHFGREQFQIFLIEYILSVKTNYTNVITYDYFKEHSFNSYLKDIYVSNGIKYDSKERNKAIIGISGMLKFGFYNSPILLSALGDLLYEKGAFLLSARSYLMASNYSNKSKIKEYYKEIAALTLSMQKVTGVKVNGNNDDKLKRINKELNKELVKANKYINNIFESEITWIKEGNNPEIEFDKKYYNDFKSTETISLTEDNEEFGILD
ncbi:MAG: tetratricopeptide repeat protein [Spirochaetaceae bacterium]